MFIPSGYYRRKALAALKGHWQPALLVALIVNLPTMLMQGFSIFTGNDLFDRLGAFIVSSSRDGVLTQQALLQEINTLLASTTFWVIRGLELLAMLVTPCLALGMYKWLMDLLHGQEQPVNAVFCRMRLFLKAIGLQLLIILKIILWALPGLALMIVVMLPVLRAGSSQAQAEALAATQATSFLPMLLMIVPGVIAALRYALAEYIMAEKPESKIRFCVSHSKELMKDQKKNLFFLMTSFLLWYLLELLISSFLTGILSLVFQMFAGLVLSVYMTCSISVFYMRLEHAAETGESPNAEPAPDELN